MNATHNHSLQVSGDFRRDLRVWLALHDRTASATAAEAAETLLDAEHDGIVYVPPPPGTHRISFSVPDALHRRIIANLNDSSDHALWSHGIRTIRDFYLVALSQHINSNATANL